ncbi:ATP-dependent DNA ligase [bacterium]|nr:ATP-dependent DNA ligase [bacterium]
MNQVSLKKFGDLIKEIDQCKGNNKKINLIAEFIKDIDPSNGCWTVSLLMNIRQKRLITGKKLREILQTRTTMPSWLFDDCFAQVGDSAETLSLLWPQIKEELNSKTLECPEDIETLYSDMNSTKPLHWWMETLLPIIKSKAGIEQENSMIELWKKIPEKEHYLLNKLITGGFRIGVSKGLVVKSIASAYELDESIILERLMTIEAPTKEWFLKLVKHRENNQSDRGAIPYPFYLASPVNLDQVTKFPIHEWRLENKWDGIRGQLIRRESGIFLWSRGEELINTSFPEIISMAENIPYGTVLDGEIICWKNGSKKPMTFASLQRRLGRKSVSNKLIKEYPAKFVAYDILENNSEDQRNVPLRSRIEQLEELQTETSHPDLVLGECKRIMNWEQLRETRDKTVEEGAEGLMIKKTDSVYLAGRKKGNWWKYKHDPMTLDVVLIYAQAGTGKRANLFTDYTFALWDRPNTTDKPRKLVTFAKAYSGLNNEEIINLDRWIRTHTKERFGPTRVVEEQQVFEIAFEGVMESKRHKCGLAVRFPRIHRWRVDKTAEEADCLKQAQALCQQD